MSTFEAERALRRRFDPADPEAVLRHSTNLARLGQNTVERYPCCSMPIQAVPAEGPPFPCEHVIRYRDDDPVHCFELATYTGPMHARDCVTKIGYTIRMTKQVAESEAHYYLWDDRYHYNAGGVYQVRVNGKCRTWKRDPERFRLPVKRGFYHYDAVEEFNQDHFFLRNPDRLPNGWERFVSAYFEAIKYHEVNDAGVGYWHFSAVFTRTARMRAEYDCVRFMESQPFRDYSSICVGDQSAFLNTMAKLFWLTRNRHGHGFWAEPERFGGYAEMLTNESRRAGECWVIGTRHEHHDGSTSYYTLELQ